MLRDTCEAPNVGKQHRDRLIHTTEFERLRIVEHLFDDILGKEPTIVGARHFFPRKSLVRASIFDCDGSLSCDRANQFQIVRFESSKGIESIGIESAVDARLRDERRTDG